MLSCDEVDVDFDNMLDGGGGDGEWLDFRILGFLDLRRSFPPNLLLPGYGYVFVSNETIRGHKRGLL